MSHTLAIVTVQCADYELLLQIAQSLQSFRDAIMVMTKQHRTVANGLQQHSHTTGTMGQHSKNTVAAYSSIAQQKNNTNNIAEVIPSRQQNIAHMSDYLGGLERDSI